MNGGKFFKTNITLGLLPKSKAFGRSADAAMDKVALMNINCEALFDLQKQLIFTSFFGFFT